MTVFEKHRMLEERMKEEEEKEDYLNTLVKISDVDEEEKFMKRLGQQIKISDGLYREIIPLVTRILRTSRMNFHDAKHVLPDFLESQLGEAYQFAIHFIDGKNYYVLQKDDYAIEYLSDLWEIQGDDPESIVILHRTEDRKVDEKWESYYVSPFDALLRSKVADYNPVSTVATVLDNFIQAYVEAKCENQDLTMESFALISEYALTKEEMDRELEAEQYFRGAKQDRCQKRKRDANYEKYRRANIIQLRALGKVNDIPAKYLKGEQKAHIRYLTLNKTHTIAEAAKQIDATSYRKNV